jgi:hypothetical protein
MMWKPEEEKSATDYADYTDKKLSHPLTVFSVLCNLRNLWKKEEKTAPGTELSHRDGNDRVAMLRTLTQPLPEGRGTSELRDQEMRGWRRVRDLRLQI